MGRVRIIPVLLLSKGGLYKTVKFQQPQYVGDPINSVKIFNEKEADEIAVLDFRASADSRGIDFKKVTEIAGEAFMPMSYGGGITTLDDAIKIFNAGYEKLILNSILFNDLTIIGKIAEIYGAQAVVGSIDVKKNIFGKYKVYSHSGQKNTGKDPVEWAKILEKSGVGEIMINSIDRDGTRIGFDEILVNKVSSELSVPVIACGGAGRIEDFKKAVDAGASAVAAGSFFVFKMPHKAVLISYPGQQELKENSLIN